MTPHRERSDPMSPDDPFDDEPTGVHSPPGLIVAAGATLALWAVLLAPPTGLAEGGILAMLAGFGAALRCGRPEPLDHSPPAASRGIARASVVDRAATTVR